MDAEVRDSLMSSDEGHALDDADVYIGLRTSKHMQVSAFARLFELNEHSGRA